jgi:putative protein-disulfide isomerase
MQTESPPPVRRILYAADPMCSWCYGFAPVIQDIARAYGEAVPVRLVVGGLRRGMAAPMDENLKDHLRHHWVRVGEATGQPFDFAFLDRDGFVYDTDPGCRAAVAVRNLAPDATLGYFGAVQRAFYAEGRDVTRIDVLAAVAREQGLDEDVFRAVFASAEIGEATAADYRICQVLGIDAFPSVVLQDGTRYAYLTVGYRPFAELKGTLDSWVAG